MANTLKIKRGTAATIPQGQLAEPLFTTDTYDLYIGKGGALGNQRFQKYIASGTSSQFLKGDGTLDSTSYQPLITAGTTLQYYRGDKTFQTLDTSVVPENGPIYFTEPRVRATVLTGLNLSGGGTIAATDSILTAFGKVQNQISALVGGATYQGTWNASTNTPTLASGTGTKGYYYIVSVNGTTDLDGITDWKIGDWAIFNGTTWDKVDNTDAVSSVNGFTGAVNLALDNISDVSAASPTNGQLLRFNGTSSLWENWTPTFEPALTKGDLTSGDTSYLTVSGGTGAVIGSGTTISILASGIVNGGLTLTTTGNSGAATKTFATLNIPNYTLAGLGGVPTTRTITINGTAQDLSADRSWSVGTITGSGTASYVPKFTGASAIGNSLIYDNGTNVLVGTATSNIGRFQVSGAGVGGVLVTTDDSNFGFGLVNSASSNKTWDFSPQGNNLQFNESGVAPVLIFKAGGGNNVRLYSYASNGFLKTSASDGTLIVDTTSYLPLTGGTLTGALSGTSATFNVGSATTVLGLTGNGNGATIASITNTDTGSSARSSFQVTSDSSTAHYFASSSTNVSTATGGRASTAGIFTASGDTAGGLAFLARNAAGVITFHTGGNTERVRIAANGETTFNNNVTLANGSDLVITPATSGVNATLYNDIGKLVSTASLVVNGTGEFSSSVTAVQGIFSASAGTYAGGSLILKSSAGTNPIYLTSNGGFFALSNGGGADHLLIASTGAATFSSSVTAANFVATTGNNTTVFNSTAATTGWVQIALNNTSGSLICGIESSVAGTVATNSTAYATVLRNYTNTDFQIGTNNAVRMTISGGGNVGIGTTSPKTILSINAGTGAYPTLGTNVNNSFFVGRNDGLVGTYFGYASDGNGWIQQMRNDSATAYNLVLQPVGGEVLIGTTTDSGNYKLQVSGNTYTAGTITTHAPSASSIGTAWKLGGYTNTTVAAASGYLLVEVGGSLYYVGLVSPL